MKSTEEILMFINLNKALLRERFHIVRIGIFVSYARGEQHEDSDVDLLVEFEEGTTNLYDLKLQLREFFKASLGIETDVCREKYIKPRLKSSILKEAIYAD
jgi:predicted nucleotidyltransferase